MRQFLLPDLGEGLEEAEIVAWHVTEGDHVVADQPLVSVETDKAVVEVPSPQSGRIARLFGAKGDLVKVGAPLVEFAEGPQADTGTVVGDLRPRATFSPARRRAAQAGEPAPARPLQVLPAVRALARKLDVDLNLVHGSGPERHHHARRCRARRQEPRRGRTGRAAARHAPRHGPAHGRGACARSCPPPSPTRPTSATGAAGEDVTIRLVRAIAAACKAEPSLNAWYNARPASARLVQRVDLGIAVDTEGGLIVPVLRNVGRARRTRPARRPRPHARGRRGTLDPARRAARRHHHALQLRHDRRALCQPRGGAAAGGDRRCRPHRPARRRARGPAGGARACCRSPSPSTTAW